MQARMNPHLEPQASRFLLCAIGNSSFLTVNGYIRGEYYVYFIIKLSRCKGKKRPTGRDAEGPSPVGKQGGGVCQRAVGAKACSMAERTCS